MNRYDDSTEFNHIAGEEQVKLTLDPEGWLVKHKDHIAQMQVLFNLIQKDNHYWSSRPCQTCQKISVHIDQPFGCYSHKDQRFNWKQKV